MRHFTRLAVLAALCSCLAAGQLSEASASMAGDCCQPKKDCCPQINLSPVLRCRTIPANALRAPIVRPVCPIRFACPEPPVTCCAPRPASCAVRLPSCAAPVLEMVPDTVPLEAPPVEPVTEAPPTPVE